MLPVFSFPHGDADLDLVVPQRGPFPASRTTESVSLSRLPSFHFLIRLISHFLLLFEPFGIYGPPAPLVWGPV